MENEDAVRSTIQRFVDASELAGAAALQWRRDSGAAVAAVGLRALEASRPVERDTIFRIASMTKPITTVAALILLDEGRFALDDPITIYAPEFEQLRVLRNPDGPLDDVEAADGPITFRHLLTHTSGLTYGEFHRGPIGTAFADAMGALIDSPLTPDAWIARLADLPLIDQPGVNFHYSASTDLLGLLIGRLAGESFGAFLSRRVLVPLGMHDTGFALTQAQRDRRSALVGFDAEGRLTTLTAVPGRHALAERPGHVTFESGGQGLWSTLDDYLTFARMLIGDAQVPALLRPETLAMMTTNQLTPEQRASARMFGRPMFAAGHGYGMGVAVVLEPELANPLCCKGGIGTVGWPGAYGGWWQADPTDQSVMIFLTHNMLELSQMAAGTGLGVFGAISSFHALATA